MKQEKTVLPAQDRPDPDPPPMRPRRGRLMLILALALSGFLAVDLAILWFFLRS